MGYVRASANDFTFLCVQYCYFLHFGKFGDNKDETLMTHSLRKDVQQVLS